MTYSIVSVCLQTNVSHISNSERCYMSNLRGTIFYMKTNVLQDFHLISVLLRNQFWIKSKLNIQ